MVLTVTKGDQVMAKWPGSTKYYPAKVVDMKQNETVVVFEDGTELSVESKFIKNSKSFIPKSRSKSRSRSPSRTKKKASLNRSRRRRSRSRSPAAINDAFVVLREMPQLVYGKSLETPVENMPSLRSRQRTKTLEKVLPSRSSARLGAQQPDQAMRTEELLPLSSDSDSDPDVIEVKPWGLMLKKCAATLLILLVPVLLPAIMIWFIVTCNKTDCSIYVPLKFPRRFSDYVSLPALAMYGGWLLLHVLLTLIPIGKVSKGLPLADGSCLAYRLNGFYTLATVLLMMGCAAYFGIPLDYVSKNIVPFIVAAAGVSVISSVALCASARKILSRNLKPSGSGNAVVDAFYYGSELNPRFGTLDMKMLFFRLGLNGWATVICAYVWEDWMRQGSPLKNLSLWTVAAFQLLYILHCHWTEEAMLGSWDIKYEGMGFMLISGCLVFMPVVFTLPLRYLLYRKMETGLGFLAGFAVLYAIGLFLFHYANKQKNEFRKSLQYNSEFYEKTPMTTTQPQKLLAEGLWGFVRHPNYLGDLLMAIAWTLPCGFGHLVPFAYFIYLSALLLSRTIQMETKCHVTYGSLWEDYKQQVPYRIIPYVF